jgi:hypothetical protein
VTPENLARCRREEQEWEASEAAKWAALDPVEQATMKTLEFVADDEIESLLEIVAAAKRRRPGVATAVELGKVMLPTDPDYAEVIAAFRRMESISTMLEGDR